jgi:hypothetical protein
MPKRTSTVVIMRRYPPLSSGRWYTAAVQAVSLERKRTVCFEFTIVSTTAQAGRRVVHRLPAVLAPGSPLCAALARGFRIRVAENESFELATLTGRAVRVRFTQPDANGGQEIDALQALGTNEPGDAPPTGGPDDEEVHDGLG